MFASFIHILPLACFSFYLSCLLFTPFSLLFKIHIFPPRPRDIGQYTLLPFRGKYFQNIHHCRQYCLFGLLHVYVFLMVIYVYRTILGITLRDRVTRLYFCCFPIKTRPLTSDPYGILHKAISNIS